MSDKEAMSLLPDNKEVIEIVTRTIIEIPADNPSNPSIKLIALVIPTIQNKVTIPERNVIASLGKYPNPFYIDFSINNDNQRRNDFKN